MGKDYEVDGVKSEDETWDDLSPWGKIKDGTGFIFGVLFLLPFVFLGISLLGLGLVFVFGDFLGIGRQFFGEDLKPGSDAEGSMFLYFLYGLAAILAAGLAALGWLFLEFNPWADRMRGLVPGLDSRRGLREDVAYAKQTNRVLIKQRNEQILREKYLETRLRKLSHAHDRSIDDSASADLYAISRFPTSSLEFAVEYSFVWFSFDENDSLDGLTVSPRGEAPSSSKTFGLNGSWEGTWWEERDGAASSEDEASPEVN